MALTKKILDLNKRAWDRLAGSYDDRDISPVSKVFLEFAGYLPTEGRVLDLGCGTGIPYAKELTDRGFNVTGVDLSEEMVKVASRNVPGARFVQMSMTEIPYLDDFDGVMSSFSMLLLSPELFNEAARRIVDALVDGGLFYLSLNEPPNTSDNADGEVYVNIMGQGMYSRAYTVEEIEETFKPLGFKLVKFHRETQFSDEFGEEHVVEFIYRKS